MKLYADTANLNDITELFSLGAINGVTTNPSIIAKEPKGAFLKLINPIADFCLDKNLSLSVEVFNTSYEEIIIEAKNLAKDLKKFENILKIKVPVTYDGLKAIKTLSDEGIKVNATACYSEQQLILVGSTKGTQNEE